MYTEPLAKDQIGTTNSKGDIQRLDNGDLDKKHFPKRHMYDGIAQLFHMRIFLTEHDFVVIPPNVDVPSSDMKMAWRSQLDSLKRKSTS